MAASYYIPQPELRRAIAESQAIKTPTMELVNMGWRIFDGIQSKRRYKLIDLESARQDVFFAMCNVVRRADLVRHLKPFNYVTSVIENGMREAFRIERKQIEIKSRLCARLQRREDFNEAS